MAIDTTNRQSVLANITGAEGAAKGKYADAATKMQEGLSALLGGDPSASTAKIRGYGDTVAGIAGEVKPIAGDIRALGGEIADIGRGIGEQGNLMLGIGNDILGMNRGSSSPLVQALLGLYDAYSPDRLASMAGQDVANRYDAARGQQQREMSRAGVNQSSGRYATLAQQFQTALATAQAAAKTRASMAGLDRQAEFLRTNIAGLGSQLAGQGVSQQAQGAATLGNAVGAENTAAGVLANAASIFSSAASLEGNAANMDLGFAKDVAGQQNAMANLDVATAGYYANLFGELLSYDAQQMTGGIGGFTVSKTTPFERIGAGNGGHTDTYWKNHPNG